MDWFLYDKDLRHERVNNRHERVNNYLLNRCFINNFKFWVDPAALEYYPLFETQGSLARFLF